MYFVAEIADILLKKSVRNLIMEIHLTLCNYCIHFHAEIINRQPINNDVCNEQSILACNVKSSQWIRENQFPVPLEPYPMVSCDDFEQAQFYYPSISNKSDTDHPIYDDDYWIDNDYCLVDFSHISHWL
jgi:hypothetical protein